MLSGRGTDSGQWMSASKSSRRWRRAKPSMNHWKFRDGRAPSTSRLRGSPASARRGCDHVGNQSFKVVDVKVRRVDRGAEPYDDRML